MSIRPTTEEEVHGAYRQHIAVYDTVGESWWSLDVEHRRRRIVVLSWRGWLACCPPICDRTVAAIAG